MLTYPDVATDGPAHDPYRWLEKTGQQVDDFVAAQNAFSAPLLAALPAREEFHRLVSALLRAPTRKCPFVRGGSYFAWHNDGTNQDVLVVADSLEGLEGGRVLLDANALSSDGTVAVTSATVSPDGSLLAYAASDGGSDWRTIRIRDVASGVDLDEVIEWVKWSDPVWLPGGRAFSYWAYDRPTGAALLDEQSAGRLMCHVVGTPVAEDTVLFECADRPRLFAAHGLRDDDWFILDTSDGASSGNELSVRAWDAPAVVTQQLAGMEYQRIPFGVRNGLLYLTTNAGAHRYRLATIDLSTGEETTIVAEHPSDVLLGAELTASSLVLWYSTDASHRMQLASIAGDLGDQVPLGDCVSIVEVQAVSDSDEFFVTTTSFVDRGTRHVVTSSGPTLNTHSSLPAPGPAQLSASTTRIRTTSADGTVIPAFVVAMTDQSGPRPTLIWGYGGFDIQMTPEFRPMLAAWVAAGGVLVVPNLRGGGEFGTEWHEAGTKGDKQNVFDDLYAVAEYLIATGVTTAEQLALHGRSNGGLLAGAALTQRPDLWAVVLPGVGVLDMLRFHLFTIGWAWISDYGDPDDEEAAVWLRAYSPVHNIRPGTAYPPTLITTGDHDDRVVPAHSYKFAAALQKAQGAEAPILLSVDTRAGHGMGKPKDAQAEEFANQLAFAARYTGLDPDDAIKMMTPDRKD